MSIVATRRPAAHPVLANPERYSDLIRLGRIDGHDAGPDDYDAALKAVADVSAWAVRHGHDLVEAVARGLMTAILTIDPRNPEPPY